MKTFTEYLLEKTGTKTESWVFSSKDQPTSDSSNYIKAKEIIKGILDNPDGAAELANSIKQNKENLGLDKEYAKDVKIALSILYYSATHNDIVAAGSFADNANKKTKSRSESEKAEDKEMFNKVTGTEESIFSSKETPLFIKDAKEILSSEREKAIGKKGNPKEDDKKGNPKEDTSNNLKTLEDKLAKAEANLSKAESDDNDEDFDKYSGEVEELEDQIKSEKKKSGESTPSKADKADEADIKPDSNKDGYFTKSYANLKSRIVEYKKILSNPKKTKEFVAHSKAKIDKTLAHINTLELKDEKHIKDRENIIKEIKELYKNTPKFSSTTNDSKTTTNEPTGGSSEVVKKTGASEPSKTGEATTPENSLKIITIADLKDRNGYEVAKTRIDNILEFLNYNAMSENNSDEKRARKYNKLAASLTGRSALRKAARIQKYMSQANGEDEHARNKVAPKISGLIYQLNVDIVKLRKINNTINYRTFGERNKKKQEEEEAAKKTKKDAFNKTPKGIHKAAEKARRAEKTALRVAALKGAAGKLGNATADGATKLAVGTMNKTTSVINKMNNRKPKPL